MLADQREMYHDPLKCCSEGRVACGISEGEGSEGRCSEGGRIAAGIYNAHVRCVEEHVDLRGKARCHGLDY